MANRSMTFRWVTEDLMLVVDHTDSLDDRDWDGLVGAIAGRSFGPTGARFLVYNAGGGPNAAQRARFDRLMRGKSTRIAVLSTSVVTRIVIKAFHALGFLHVAGFAPDQEEAAFRHLSMSPAEIVRLREEQVKMRAEARPQSTLDL